MGDKLEKSEKVVINKDKAPQNSAEKQVLNKEIQYYINYFSENQDFIWDEFSHALDSAAMGYTLDDMKELQHLKGIESEMEDINGEFYEALESFIDNWKRLKETAKDLSVDICARCLNTIKEKSICKVCGRFFCDSCLTKCPQCKNKVCPDCLVAIPEDHGGEQCAECAQDIIGDSGFVESLIWELEPDYDD